MRRNFRTPYKRVEDKGEENKGKNLTQPDMHTDPRTVLEMHVRGINPITGANISSSHYYGDNVLPYAKDLTFEELQLRRKALQDQEASLGQQIQEQLNTDDGTNPGTTPPDLDQDSNKKPS